MRLEPHGLTDFQIEALKGLAAGRDVILHAGTGSGKTAVIAALHMLDKTKGMVSFVVSPLIALQDEQVSLRYVGLVLPFVLFHISHLSVYSR